MIELNILLAFGGGLASFLAPCVIPLVPAYISFLSGVSLSELTKNSRSSTYKLQVLTNSLFYVAGFSLVFVLLGLGATTISRILITDRVLLTRFGGLVIIFFGLYSLDIFKYFQFSQKQFSFTLPKSLVSLKFLGAFLMGTTFAFVWTPCIGPILGAILTLAATSSNAVSGTFLLFVYSLGISLPFLLIALTLGSSYKILSRLGPKLYIINSVTGVLLVLVGLLMFFQQYDLLAASIIFSK